MHELVTNTLTFPGAMLHEYAHAVVARRRGLEIRELVLFRPLANPAGYVSHQSARTSADALTIAFAPLLINTLAAVLVAFATIPALSVGLWPAVGVLWLSWSCGLHAIPSLEDVADVAALTRGRWRRVAVRALVAPVQLLKVGELVGTGYLFATVTTTTGALASVALFDSPTAALAFVEEAAALLLELLEQLVG